MSKVHPTAVVEDGAQIGQDVEIGPYCVIGPNVVLGDRVKLHSHVAMAGHTTLGEECEVYPFASVGHAPQDLKFKGEQSRLIVGKRTKIRRASKAALSSASARKFAKVRPSIPVPKVAGWRPPSAMTAF